MELLRRRTPTRYVVSLALVFTRGPSVYQGQGTLVFTYPCAMPFTLLTRLTMPFVLWIIIIIIKRRSGINPIPPTVIDRD